MPVKSTENSYGSVAVTLHWLSALLIVAVLGIGFRAAGTVDASAKAQLLGIHVALAIAVVVLTLARLFWWWFADRKPGPVSGVPRWQHVSARTVHALFYVVILGMGASGVGMLVLSGAGPIILGGADGQLPDFREFLPRTPHGIGAWIMVALLVLHVGAALYHQFVRRDRLLRRMWYGKG